MNRNVMGYDSRKGVGDVGMDIALLALVGVGAYLLFKNFGSLFQSTASAANAANNSAITQSTTAANQATQDQVAASGQKASLTPATINAMADTITHAMTATGDYPLDDTDYYNEIQQITNAVIAVNNTADWVALVSAFGTKQLLNGQNVDLLTGLSVVLPQLYKSPIDSYFVSQGIGSPNFIMIP